ncbi:MAG: Na(+)-translocating NADH-quinone reductase subunit C [Candidatus Latescibacterota bacterium]
MFDKDSIGGTLGVALGVCLVCSVLVSAAAVSLRPAQSTNRALDKKRNILRAAGLLEPGRSIDELYAQIQPRLVDLDSGEYVSGADAQAYDQRAASRDPEQSRPLSPAEDLASIKRRARRAPVYLVVQQDQVRKVVLPINGLGLWSQLYGFVALDAGDLTTVRGLVFYEHAETPGLGGEVDNPHWLALWQGKKGFGEGGEVRLQVIKGKVHAGRPGAEFQVDGLSGATLTSRGVTNMLRFWLGQNGFGSYLARLREQGVQHHG